MLTGFFQYARPDPAEGNRGDAQVARYVVMGKAFDEIRFLLQQIQVSFAGRHGYEVRVQTHIMQESLPEKFIFHFPNA